MAARSWIGTLNNPQVETVQEYLEKWVTTAKARYCTGLLEQGEQGTVHVQFFLNFEKPQRMAALKKHCQRAHFLPVKVDNGAAEYCNKEETRLEGPWEFGTKPVKRNSKADWDEVWKKAKEGKLEEIPADIRVKHYGHLKQIAKDHLPMPEESKGLRGTWIHGPAGCGKSRMAYDKWPGAYRKLANKWWDGYQGQSAVVLEDLGKEHHVLGHHLKLWADRYPFIGETKGGAIAPSYEDFVVTSLYKIEQIWEDLETRDALNRRFKVIELN